MKKLALALMAVVAGASAFGEVNYRFTNKVSSDTMNIRHIDGKYNDPTNERRHSVNREFLAKSEIDDKSSHTDTQFLNVDDEFKAELKTSKIDAMIKAKFAFGDLTNDGDYGFKWKSEIEDWYVEYRPFDSITFGFHDAIYMDGSYLPIYDDNLYSGNIGSEGITGVYRPAALKGALRLAVTTPFTASRANYVLSDEDHEDVGKVNHTFNTGVGAIYTARYFQFGATVQDLFDGNERRIGMYVNFPELFGNVKEISVGGGFAHSADGWIHGYGGNSTFSDYTYFGGVNGKNIMNAYFTYNGKSVINAEMVYNLDSKGNNYWDFYTAASVQFWISSPLSITIVGKLVTDIDAPKDKDLENIYAAEGRLNFKANKQNEFQAGVKADFFDGNSRICFPVYWKYTF
ncbi:MAG: hypothetical protein KBT11_12140 [Treponema sp.]|nr:hypothetical protein [Candidatus Treponema equifaecale]